MQSKGFTLLEMMVVVVIVAVLATVALPSYQHYVVRAKMADALVHLDAIRPTIEEYYEVNGRMPANMGELGLDNQQVPLDEIVREIRMTGSFSSDDKVFYVMLNDGVAPLSRGDAAFGLHARPHGDNPIHWNCTRLGLASEYLPAGCRNKTW